MPLQAISSDDGKTLTLVVEGRFDFGMYDDFRAAYANANATQYVIDLARAEYLDSPALAEAGA